jgi:hypothetical protein
MANAPHDEAFLLQRVAEVSKYPSLAAAAIALGVSLGTLKSQLHAAEVRGLWRSPRRRAMSGETQAPPVPPAALPPEGFVITSNSSTFDKDGALVRQSIRSQPDSGDVFEVPAGHVVKGESALLDPDGRIMARWVKTREGAGEGLVDALRATFAEFDGACAPVPAPEDTEDDILTVYPLPDLHFGMYAWAPETGADYDTTIAAEVAQRTIGELVRQSRPSRQAVLLGLGDYFHANDHKAATPASGNRLDVDTRWAAVFAAGARLATELVHLIAQKHDDVEVVFLPGNHDPDAAICLTVALKLFYSRTPRIHVHDGPGLIWYRRFGKTLIGATHGHTMKPAVMGALMASDRPKDWGATEHRHFLFGHVHKRTSEDVGGVLVESLSAATARDAWTAGAGYRSGRMLAAVTYHRERGEIGRHRVALPNPTDSGDGGE